MFVCVCMCVCVCVREREREREGGRESDRFSLSLLLYIKMIWPIASLVERYSYMYNNIRHARLEIY